MPSLEPNRWSFHQSCASCPSHAYGPGRSPRRTDKAAMRPHAPTLQTRPDLRKCLSRKSSRLRIADRGRTLGTSVAPLRWVSHRVLRVQPLPTIWRSFTQSYRKTSVLQSHRPTRCTPTNRAGMTLLSEDTLSRVAQRTYSGQGS